MGMLQEFRDFAVRGNVVDMAVGVIIGAAFGKITTSLVNDVMMPPLGMLLGGVDFSDKAVVLRAAEGAVPGVAVKYGIFVNTIIDFAIVALAVFFLVKAINSLRKQQAAAPAPPPAPTREELLLTEIRDALRARS
jgi:large conductance mechanosensitive channel